MRITRGSFLIGAILLGPALILLSQATPYMLPVIAAVFRIPYIAQSVLIEYLDKDSTGIEVHVSSWQRRGAEVVLSSSFPGRPLRTAVRRPLDTAGLVLLPLADRFAGRSERSAAAFVRSGCVSAGSRVVGKDTILGYPTVVVETGLGPYRTTSWLAPDLECFPLKSIMQEQRPDGAVVLRSERRTFRVNTFREASEPLKP